MRALSRNGRDVYNVDHITQALESVAPNCVIDGEFYATDWNDSMSILKTRKLHPDAHKIRLLAFDLIPLQALKEKFCALPFEVRKNNLSYRIDLLKSRGLDCVEFVEGIPSDDPGEVRALTEAYLEQGWEGAVLKREGSPYSFSRSKDWLKFKPMMEPGKGVSHANQQGKFKITGIDFGYRDTVTAAVYDLHEVDDPHDRRYQFVVRRVAVQVALDSDGTPVECAVGGGFTIEQRVELARSYKKDPTRVLGHLVRVAFQGKTPDGMLRFPEFKGMAD